MHQKPSNSQAPPDLLAVLGGGPPGGEGKGKKKGWEGIEGSRGERRGKERRKGRKGKGRDGLGRSPDNLR